MSVLQVDATTRSGLESRGAYKRSVEIMNDGCIDLLAAIYKQAVRDDYDTVASNIVQGLKDMSIKEQDARKYIKSCEEAMAEIKKEIQHNVYKESKEYGDPKTRVMQANSISSFEGIVNDLIKAYRMTDKEKNDRVATCQEMEKNIAQLLEEKERWQAIAEKVTPTITGMPSGGDGEDQRELAVCNMVDCDKAATKEIDKLCTLKDKIKRYIMVTGDYDSRLLGLVKEQE
jgi:hypothetical protein